MTNRYKTVCCSVCGLPLFEYLALNEYDTPGNSPEILPIESKKNVFRHQTRGYLCGACYKDHKDEEVQ